MFYSLSKKFKTSIIEQLSDHSAIIDKERERLILWIPVLFGVGIFGYFNRTSEPDLKITTSILFVSILITSKIAKSRINLLLTYLLVIITTIISGFTVAAIYSASLTSPIVNVKDEVVWIRATVDKMETMTTGKRVILSDLDLWQPPPIRKFAAEHTPDKIRLTIRTKMENITPGDRVSVKAILSPPPPKPVYPAGYDFAQFAYFNKIGAVGFSIADVKIRKKHDDITIEKIRNATSQRITEALSEDKQKSAKIAVALLTGEKSGIDKSILESMRQAGLGHLLAISGLHMTLVMATSFFVIRLFLAAIPAIALRYNIKKIAAASALITGLIYLFLTGTPISARRAYIMAGIFFTTILLDRLGTIMRPVAISAIFIMILSPESVTTPSFQMSFAAVIGLIAAFEHSSSLFRNKKTEGLNIIKMLLLYTAGVIFSSLVAGLVTLPFSVYHFGRHANYGILANMVAIPLTSFWIMPFGILSLLLMPFGLESIALIPMEWGIRILIDYSFYISSMSNANIAIAEPNNVTIIFTTISLLWICLWRSIIRYIAIVPIIIGFYLIFNPPEGPDIIVNEKGLFATRTIDGKLAFASFRGSRYVRSVWLKINGQKYPLRIKDSNINAKCTKEKCIYNTKNKSVLIIRGNNTHIDDCNDYNLIVNLSTDMTLCSKNDMNNVSKMISLNDLKSEGTHAIWLNSEINIKTVKEKRGNRLWTSQIINNKKDI